MTRTFLMGSRILAPVKYDCVERINYIACVIISENSLKNAEKIYRGIVNKYNRYIEEYSRNDIKKIKKDEFSEITKIYFFIEEDKESLIDAVYDLILKDFNCEKLYPVELKVEKYKKLSDDFLIKTLLDVFDYVIFFLAAGAAVRLIAPHLKDKFNDPGVITIDESGKFVVSLLSGHIGGANRLADEISGYLENSIPVITTATDSKNKFSIDAFAEKFDFYIENAKQKIQNYNEASLNGERLEIILEDLFKFIEVKSYIKNFSNAKKIKIDMKFNFLKLNKSKIILVTVKKIPNEFIALKNIAVLRPKRLVVGIGCNRKTSFSEIEDFAAEIFEKNNLSLNSIRNVASIDKKKGEEGLLEFGYKYGRFIDFYSKDEINSFMESLKYDEREIKTDTKNKIRKKNKEIKNELKLSEYAESASFKYTGAYSVCEPCAMMSAKNDVSPLLIPKQKKGNVTAAVATVYDF